MILVTGAAGFIGSNLVADLNEAGRDDIIACDWLSDDGRWENLSKRSFHDLLLPEQLEGVLASAKGKRIDAVLHMGAISATTATDGNLVLKRNYQYTKMLWEWCAANGATFVYASSAATYGDRTDHFDDRLDYEGLRQLRPLNLYGWSKHMFDLFAVKSTDPAPPHWYGLKFFNVFGPNEYHKESMRSVVCKLAPDILLGKPAKLFKSHRPDFSDGGQTRDFIFVYDVCKAVLHFARGEAESGIYNVGTGQARSFADLVSAAYRAAGHEPNIEYIDMPMELRSRYQYFTEASTDKLRSAGYNLPFLKLEEAVEIYVKQHLAAEDRYR
ncbi:ADP-glyceromanno-heptose 6-epimerase [Methylocapsa acidiphila]|uniref:ADP-glyceromanno-heptose 6-epimerase n=1 Tax=Methylocapsa acidiphila TaxID=133552 RepID=UPI00040BF21C|nr:ADP-glyceromanno-heptose 6-epimerase [Methylocapsa acidiphila]